jgi:ferredoxin
MSFYIELDHGKCIGCLACTRCENFKCGEDFKAYAVRKEVEDLDCNRKAADLCPVNAIIVLPA